MPDVATDIARAVLYEGHMLFPYRPSSLKNVQRWTFGGVYPHAYAEDAGDRSRVSFTCLVEGDEPRCAVEFRFLQMVAGEVNERTAGGGEVELPPLRGRIEATFAAGVLSASLENLSDWQGSDRAEALEHSFLSAHAVARVERGAFVSPRETDQPLRQEGLWPVLVGEPGDRSTLLASPIVLDDYPRVAPESPGDFFDGCEIDQLLVLGILGLCDAEKEEIRTGDPRARAILERTEAMTGEEIMRLHGTWRQP